MNSNIQASEIETLRKKMDFTTNRGTLNHYGHSLQDMGQKAGYFTPVGKLLFEAGDTLIVYTKPENDDDVLATGIMRAKRAIDKAIAQMSDDTQD